MSPDPLGGPRPNNSARRTNRQLTIGECAAIARYGPAIMEEGDQTAALEAILGFIDRIGVCTTCGWPARYHEQDSATRASMHICAHWTRKM